MATYGEIYSIQAANQDFGPVQNSIQLAVVELKPLLNITGASIMFKIINNQVVILDSQRRVIYPQAFIINPEEVFTLYTTSVLESLLDQGSGQDIEVQQRTSVLSIGYSDKVMETGTNCPPNCPQSTPGSD